MTWTDTMADCEGNGHGDSSSWESMDEEEDACQNILQNNLVIREKMYSRNSTIKGSRIY